VYTYYINVRITIIIIIIIVVPLQLLTIIIRVACAHTAVDRWGNDLGPMSSSSSSAAVAHSGGMSDGFGGAVKTTVTNYTLRVLLLLLAFLAYAERVSSSFPRMPVPTARFQKPRPSRFPVHGN